MYSFRGGYLGVSPIENGLTNICGLVHESRLSGLKGRWDAFVGTIRGEEKQLEALYSRYEPAQDGFLSSEPVIFRARSPVEHGVFMIGDASTAHRRSLTGNGMMAIQSYGRRSARAAGSVEGKRDDAAYRRAHAAFFGRRIRWSRRVAMILSRPALLDAALAAVRSPGAGRFLLTHTRASLEAADRLSGTVI